MSINALRALALIAILDALLVTATVAALTPIPAQAASSGVLIVDQTDLSHVEFLSPGVGVATSQIVSVQGQPFSSAMRVTTKITPTDPWMVQVSIPTNATVSKSDTIELSFFVRRIGTPDGDARIGADFESASAPYTKSLDEVLQPPANWERIDLPFRSVAGYAPGQAHMHVTLGFSAATFDLGGFALTDYGSDVAPASLPQFRLPNPCGPMDAPWRREAEARIERYREGDIEVRVRNASGAAIPGASVHVEMIRHSFDFGSAVDHWHLDGSEASDDTYRATVQKLFTKATVENELKWRYWYGPSEGREDGVQMVDWLNDRGIAVRGHNLVWPSWKMSPPQLRSDYDQHLADDGLIVANRWLEAAIDAHISDEVGALRGKVASWDVINEPVTNHDFMDILGDGAMIDWFNTAHAADPRARLYVNDYNDFYGRAKSSDIAALQGVLRTLVAGGAPLGGIGLESHFAGSLSSPDEIIRSLSEFSKFGVPIEITEYDLKTDDSRLQADYTRDFLTLCFSWPAVQSFVVWGFWDGAHWLGDAPLFNADWSLKPSGQAFEDLVYHTWWTDLTGTTSSNGDFRTRGFLGDYVLSATVDGRTKTINATIQPGDNRIVVTL